MRGDLSSSVGDHHQKPKILDGAGHDTSGLPNTSEEAHEFFMRRSGGPFIPKHVAQSAHACSLDNHDARMIIYQRPLCSSATEHRTFYMQ